MPKYHHDDLVQAKGSRFLTGCEKKLLTQEHNTIMAPRGGGLEYKKGRGARRLT